MRRLLPILAVLFGATQALAVENWNPSDTGTGSTFSNSNNTITGSAVTAAWGVTRMTTAYASGKYYSEHTITQNAVGTYGSWGVGFANGTANLNDYLGSTTSTAFGYMPQNGALLGNPGGTIQTCATGSKVQVAVDYTAKLAWIQCANAGGWNVGLSGTQNPATGAGGIDITNGALVTGPYFLAWEFDGIANPGIVTTNFGSTAFTYTPPSGFAGYNSAGGSISLSPSSVTGGPGQGGNVITITGTSTSFSGSPFTVSGGLLSYSSAQSVSSGTSGTITINPGLNGYGNLTITDTISSATATLTVTAPSLGNFIYGVIGDSISAGTNGDPVAAETTYLTGLGYTVTAYNQAIAGTSTQDWVNGTTNLNNALSAFSGHSISIVQVMLGTNDTRTPYNFSVAYHYQCMASLVQTLVANGYKVILHKPIFTEPNAVISSVLWSTDPNTTYEQYYAADMKLVDGINVFQGDTGGFQTALLAPQTFLAADGVHPAGSTANNTLGTLWGIAMQYRWGNQYRAPAPAGFSLSRGAQ